MPGTKGNSGGARQGTGPVRHRFNLSYGSAVLLRELARSRLGKKDISEAELTATIEALIAQAVDARLAEDSWIIQK